MKEKLWLYLAIPVILVLAFVFYYKTSNADDNITTYLYTNDTIYVSGQVKQRAEYGKLLVKRHNSKQFLTIGTTWTNVWELRNRTSQPITVSLKLTAYFHSQVYSRYVKHTQVPDIITVFPGEVVTLAVQSYIDPAIIEDADELMSRRAYVGLEITDPNNEFSTPNNKPSL